jgi:hypothetical protein
MSGGGQVRQTFLGKTLFTSTPTLTLILSLGYYM